MLCMDEIAVEDVSRYIFSKSLVVRTLVKSKTQVKRESSFSCASSRCFTHRVNENKYILLKSVLSSLQKLTADNEDTLYVYIDVNAYVPPPLLNNLLSLLRTKASSRKWDSFIYTAKTVTVSSLNKKAPYTSVSEESIQQAQHQLDILVFRRSFLELLLESLPDSTIVFNMEEAVMSVASARHVNVVDVTPLCTVKIEYHNS